MIGAWKWSGRALTALAIGLLALPKLALSASTHGPGIDGGYYADIAAGVRDGRLLETDVSLLHKGYPDFPHPTDVYPLWPLLYGLVARVFPLIPAGVWLATLLYFTALLAAGAWARRVWPTPFFAQGPLDAGHVAIVVLGLARSFFEMTSLPYTEGLAYTLLFLALWRAHALLPERSPRAGLELGAWAGILVLARTQLLLFLIALAAATAVVLVVGPRRARTARFGAAALAAFALVLLPQLLFVRSFLPGAGPLDLLRFERTQITTALAPYQVLRPTDGVVGFLVDRARGFAVAFGSAKAGYWSQYRLFAYAPFLAAPVVAAAALAAVRREGRAGLLARLRAPGAFATVFLALFVVGSFLAIHAMHKAPDAWYFHRRHALTSSFLFVAAIVALLAAGGRARWVGLGVLVIGAALGAHAVTGSVRTSASRAYVPPEALVRWIEAEQARRPDLVLALRRPQTVAWRTDGVGYHWFDESTRVDDLLAMVDHLGVDAVLLPPRSRVEASPAFRRRMQLDGEVARQRVWRPRAAPLPEGEDAPAVAAEPSAPDAPAED